MNSQELERMDDDEDFLYCLGYCDGFVFGGLGAFAAQKSTEKVIQTSSCESL